jgi:hypothetical protein
MKIFAALTMTLILSSSAFGQFGQYPAYPTMPGTAGIPAQPGYRPPLSPYLNLLRGGDPSINYYYAVRPGVMAGVAPMGSLSGAPGQGFNQLRSGFLPAAANPSQEPVKFPVAGVEIPSLPTSAHPVSFGGVNRFTPGGGPTFGGSMGANRPGNIGSTPPPPYTRKR